MTLEVIKQKDEITARTPTHYLKIGIQAPNDVTYDCSDILYETTVQELIDEFVEKASLPLSEGNKSIHYSLVNGGVTLNSYQTLLEAGVKDGDLIQLVLTYQPESKSVYSSKDHLRNIG